MYTDKLRPTVWIILHFLQYFLLNIFIAVHWKTAAEQCEFKIPLASLGNSVWSICIWIRTDVNVVHLRKKMALWFF